MNCRPGDVAVVVHDVLLNDAVVVRPGTLVKVVRLTNANHGSGQVWELEQPIPFAISTPLLFGIVGMRMSGEILGIDDADLRPIRPEGVTDEEVSELYAPAVPEVLHG